MTVCNDALYICLFFNDTATTYIYSLSLHDALPIWSNSVAARVACRNASETTWVASLVSPSTAYARAYSVDRKSTRLNSSHRCISYAVFCLKKKKKTQRFGGIKTYNSKGVNHDDHHI